MTMKRPTKITLTLLGIAASVGLALALCMGRGSLVPRSIQATAPTVLQPISVEWVMPVVESRVDEKALQEAKREYERNPEKLLRELNLPLDAMKPRAGSLKGKP